MFVHVSSCQRGRAKTLMTASAPMCIDQYCQDCAHPSLDLGWAEHLKQQCGFTSMVCFAWSSSEIGVGAGVQDGSYTISCIVDGVGDSVRDSAGVKGERFCQVSVLAMVKVRVGP